MKGLILGFLAFSMVSVYAASAYEHFNGTVQLVRNDQIMSTLVIENDLAKEIYAKMTDVEAIPNYNDNAPGFSKTSKDGHMYCSFVGPQYSCLVNFQTSSGAIQ